jgi:probable rRNA maturation factor
MKASSQPLTGDGPASDEGEPPSTTSGDPAEDLPRSPIGAARTDAGATLHMQDSTARLSDDAMLELRALAGRAIRTAAPGLPGEVRVRIVGDEEMARAHESYLGVGGTTDVITFDAAAGGSAPDAGGEPFDVDLLVCLDEAERQAERRGHLPEHELVLYVLHGVLHCLGHDDGDAEAFAAMHAEEDRVLCAVGLGAVFARGGEDAS